MARKFTVSVTYHQAKVLRDHLREVRMVDTPPQRVRYLQEVEEKLDEKLNGAKK